MKHLTEVYGKSNVATPDGKNRKKKKKNYVRFAILLSQVIYITNNVQALYGINPMDFP